MEALQEGKDAIAALQNAVEEITDRLDEMKGAKGPKAGKGGKAAKAVYFETDSNGEEGAWMLTGKEVAIFAFLVVNLVVCMVMAIMFIRSRGKGNAYKVLSVG